jgi:hypothetical protein
MRILLAISLLSFVLSAHADEKTWALLTSAKAQDGRELLLSSGISDETADYVIQFARDADEVLAKQVKTTIEPICANRAFYTSAPEHLAQKIDEQADAFDAFRASLADSLYNGVGVADRDKLKKFVEETFNVQVTRPERYGDSIRYGKNSSTDVVNALCGDAQ